MSSNIEQVTTYNGFEIGTDSDGQVYVSKCVSDRRYKIRECESIDEAYDYIDVLTANSDD